MDGGTENLQRVSLSFNGPPSSQGEGSEPAPEEADLQDPGNEDESAVKEVAKLNTKNKVQMKALSEARDLCYAAEKLSAQKVRGAIMGLDKIPTVTQIQKQDLFKLWPPGNLIVDDIHSHWKSYLHKYRVLADAPYSQFHPREGWDTVYTCESLEEHEPMLANTYGKKVVKPSLMVVVAPTTTEIGDDYFLNKLHEPACIKRKSVYYGAKVSAKRSRMQVVICPYCRVLSQNALAAPTSRGTLDSCLHVEVVKSSTREAPKKLQDHLGKCKEALAAKATAELVASQNETSKEGKE